MKKQAAISLLVFTALLVFTMVLHPAGGSVEHLIHISNTIIATHSIALLSLPFGWVGCLGFSRMLGTERFEVLLAFAMISLALISVMIAAATNGLILPIFLQPYKDASPETIASIKPILRYGFAINHAFDYIYTFAFSLAILCWSIAILKTKKFSAWLGWLGLLIAVGAIILFLSGISANDLTGLRIFITGIVIWIVLAGWQMLRNSPQN